MSCQVVDDFRDGDANGWSPSGGTWQVENPFYGEYSGQDGAGTQVSLWDQSMTSGRLGVTVIAQAGPEPQYSGYLVFDYLDASSYKSDQGGHWQRPAAWHPCLPVLYSRRGRSARDGTAGGHNPG